MTMDEIVKSMMAKTIEKGWLDRTPSTKAPLGNREVNILGLFWLEYGFRLITSREHFSGDVWTMSDFYRVMPWLTNVDQVYEIHSLDGVINRNDDTRLAAYKMEIRKEFKERAKKVVAVDEKLGEFLNRAVEILDYKKLHEKYPDLEFASTVDYMIMQAVEDGFDKINLYGIYLQNDRHIIYCGSLIKTINKVRELGKEIHFDWEEEIKEHAASGMECQRYIDAIFSREHIEQPE